MKGKTNSGHNNNDWGADVKYKVKAKIEGHDSGSKLKVSIKVSMKRKFLFDIFVDKGLKFRFLLLKLLISIPAVGNMYIIAYDVNTFAKSLWSAVNNSV